MHRFMLATLAISILSIGCSTPNMVVMSHHRAEYSFSKSEHIILALPKHPTEFEKGLLGPLRAAMEQDGFIVVDSIENADRILSFRFVPEVRTTDRSSLSSTSLLLSKGAVSNIVETFDTLSSISIDVRDIAGIKAGSDGLIWQSSLLTEPDFFNTCPDQIFRQLLKYYGKAVVKRLRFKPSRAR